NSSKGSTTPGTFRCSTIATMARTMAACWSGCRCRQRHGPTSSPISTPSAFPIGTRPTTRPIGSFWSRKQTSKPRSAALCCHKPTIELRGLFVAGIYCNSTVKEPSAAIRRWFYCCNAPAPTIKMTTTPPEMTMRTTQTVRLLLLSGVATAAMMAPAMALDAQAFVDRVAAVYQTMGYDFAFGPATLDGDTITVDGVTVTMA